MVPVHSPHIAIYRDLREFVAVFCIIRVLLLFLKKLVLKVLLKTQAITSSFLSQKGEFHKLADAKIFLSDCLACDSCVSAEEGIQVSQQNAKDFFQVLNLNKVWHPRLSLAPEVAGGQGEA